MGYTGGYNPFTITTYKIPGTSKYTGWLIIYVGFLGQFDRLVTKQNSIRRNWSQAFLETERDFFKWHPNPFHGRLEMGRFPVQLGSFSTSHDLYFSKVFSPQNKAEIPTKIRGPIEGF